MVLSHIWSYLPFPLMIVSAQTNYPENTSDTIPDDISVTSKKYVSILTTPSDTPQVLVLYYDDPNTKHTIMWDNTFRGRTTIRYCFNLYDGKIYHQKI